MTYPAMMPKTLKATLKRFAKRLLGLQSPNAQPVQQPQPTDPSQTVQPPQPIQMGRSLVADYYLKGTGIEIGALHNPLQVPAAATVRYVDRMSVADLKHHYPELAEFNLVPVDILDDGETLATIPDNSQDFVIANHFIEHCQDPIRTIQTIVRVLKPGGIFYMGVPDKRFIFDKHRPTTDIQHVLRDYREGPEWSRKQHFYEWAKFSFLGYTDDSEGQDDPRVAEEAQRFEDMDYSIHFHAWTQTEILELLTTLQKELQFGFEVEMFLKNQDELICILKKDQASRREA